MYFIMSVFLNHYHIILMEKPVILEQVLLLEGYRMTSSGDMVHKGQELVFSLEFLVVGRLRAGGGFWILLNADQSSFDNSLLN